MTREP
ncbi:uncharacterized protein FPRN_15244 [Fusarium proliferatum]